MTVFSMAPISVRAARTQDARAILEAHYSAVHETAARDYPPETLRAWSSPVTTQRIETYLNQSLPLETTVVAEVAGAIAGFGSIVESRQELRAVYVAAKFGGRGVGTAILLELERIARTKGCRELRMASSLTAASFYRNRGFTEINRGIHSLRSGGTMACVWMRKSLD
jgi:putative acetyltransferase